MEALSKASIFWRSFTHFVGGMGVLVFLLAILPLAGGQNMHLMRAESPGPQVGKLVPKIRSTALILYAIYAGMTVVEFIFLICGGLPLFDAITIAIGTAGTGGFAVTNAGLGGYSYYIQTVVAVFMISCVFPVAVTLGLTSLCSAITGTSSSYSSAKGRESSSSSSGSGIGAP